MTFNFHNQYDGSHGFRGIKHLNHFKIKDKRPFSSFIHFHLSDNQLIRYIHKCRLENILSNELRVANLGTVNNQNSPLEGSRSQVQCAKIKTSICNFAYRFFEGGTKVLDKRIKFKIYCAMVILLEKNQQNTANLRPLART